MKFGIKAFAATLSITFVFFFPQHFYWSTVHEAMLSSQHDVLGWKIKDHQVGALLEVHAWPEFMAIGHVLARLAGRKHG